MSKSQTTTKRHEGEKLAPIHTGGTVRIEFIEPLRLNSTKLALNVGIAPTRVTAIVQEDHCITADIALRQA